MGIFKKETSPTPEEIKNEEAAEELTEGAMDVSHELANEELDGEDILDGYRKATEDEMKAIKDFEELFGNMANPFKIMVDLAKRIKAIEDRVF